MSFKWVSAALYMAEVLGIAILMLAYRAEGKAGIGEFLSSRPGMLALVASLALCLALVFIVRSCTSASKNDRRECLFAISMNLAVVTVIVITSEILLRILVVESTTEERIGGKLLYPRTWSVVAGKFKSILERAQQQPTFWVEDKDLGWTIGSNRKSADGLYFSSFEGLRSSGPGESFAKDSPGCTIALLGDSFTFGEEVSNEKSWAYALDKQFGSQCRVLNFGVGGYGIDQMYLRYVRDVRQWKPDIVLLAFVNHDIVRTFSAYSFLLFPGGETPFAKPRFVLEGEELHQINHPLIGVNEMFTKPSIRELPFIDYDLSYNETEWDRPRWAWLNRSYVFRLLISLYPLHEPERAQVSEDELEKVNRVLLQKFLSLAGQDRARPLIVYLPSVGELPDQLPYELIGPKTLRRGELPHLNIRECMAKSYSPDVFMPPGHGEHYSAEGNRIAAECMRDAVERMLPDRKS
ncbi:hypothetical protein W02_12630 [Nitrospira sp. KM1]|nr:hypothetical protein W02_12630 [Nitrospira sp. KM1]